MTELPPVFNLPGIRSGGVDHDAVTNEITRNRTIEYGKGCTPNVYSFHQPEWVRRRTEEVRISEINDKLEMLFEPRFITPPETSGLIEAIITATDSRHILELGMCTGFGTLHMLRAILGKPGATITSVDFRPAHDAAFFGRFPEFRFVNGKTPEVLRSFHGELFDLVFVDSDHSVQVCEDELQALWPITRKGSILLFHDCPERQTPQHPEKPPAIIFSWLHSKVDQGVLRGTCLPSCEQIDCLSQWGPGYDKRCNPGLGIFVRAT